MERDEKSPLTLPVMKGDKLAHCYEMMEWAEIHPESGNPLIDIGWADWWVEAQIIKEQECQGHG